MSKRINLSPPNYQQWLETVFNHPVPKDELSGERWYHAKGLEFNVSSSIRLVRYMTQLCNRLDEVSTQYTIEQIDNGLWFVIGPTINFGMYLVDEEIPLQQRLECIHSMYYVYADFLMHSDIEVIPNIFDMWWDLLSGDFWSNVKEYRRQWNSICEAMTEEDWASALTHAKRVVEALDDWKPDEHSNDVLAAHGISREEQKMFESPVVGYQDLTEEEHKIHDAMLDTLLKILNLPDGFCEAFALHGLGHLQHPKGREAIQQFIDQNAEDFTEEELEWVKQCRDGTVM